MHAGLGVFSKAAIAFGAEITGLFLVYRAVPVADPAARHDTLAYKRRIGAFASSHNFAHGIGTLNPREDEGAAAPGRVFRARFFKGAAGCGVLDGL